MTDGGPYKRQSASEQLLEDQDSSYTSSSIAFLSARNNALLCLAVHKIDVLNNLSQPPMTEVATVKFLHNLLDLSAPADPEKVRCMSYSHSFSTGSRKQYLCILLWDVTRDSFGVSLYNKAIWLGCSLAGRWWVAADWKPAFNNGLPCIDSIATYLPNSRQIVVQVFFKSRPT